MGCYRVLRQPRQLANIRGDIWVWGELQLTFVHLFQELQGSL